MNFKKNLVPIFAILIMIIAIITRIDFLQNALWYDEACSWVISKKKSWLEIIKHLLNIDLQHSPIYFLFLNIWMKIFGDSPIALRSLSLIISILTIPMIYMVSKEFLPKKESLLITSLISSLPPIIVFSMEIRMYPMAIFLVLLSLYNLIKFEKTNQSKNLIYLTLINLLLIYTYTGAILYTLTLMICYSIYKLNDNFKAFKQYIFYAISELIMSIPFFCLIFHYAMIRKDLIIKYEMPLELQLIFITIKNLFGTNPSRNMYWPAEGIELWTPEFLFLNLIPCLYVIFGMYCCIKKGEKFQKILQLVTILIFIEFVILSILQINVCTQRYVIHILAPAMILSLFGLSKYLSKIHFKIFVIIYTIAALIGTIIFHENTIELKNNALKSVRIQANNLKLDKRDIIITTQGSDAPYYFRDENAPRLFDFNIYKQIGNHKNNNYYEKNQQKKMLTDEKYKLLYDAIKLNKCFSKTHEKYFIENVNQKVEKDRFVLMAFFSIDSNSIKHPDELINSVKSIEHIKKNHYKFIMEKYNADIISFLEQDFDFQKRFERNSYTYILFKKR